MKCISLSIFQRCFPVKTKIISDLMKLPGNFTQNLLIKIEEKSKQMLFKLLEEVPTLATFSVIALGITILLVFLLRYIAKLMVFLIVVIIMSCLIGKKR